jgi:hypothetical protein
MATTLCTFNANNLFVRYRFGQTFPGDMSWSPRKDLAAVLVQILGASGLNSGRMALVPYATTVWTDFALPLLLGFAGGAIAIFWPWLQAFFRGRKFQGIIRRELQELGPQPTGPVSGKPWWEHATKRFVHEEVFAREKVSENRDFLLSLDPTVVYRVSQLWTALAKRDGDQWLLFIKELGNDKHVGSEELRKAHDRWEAILRAQPPELRVLPRVRAISRVAGSPRAEPYYLLEARLAKYQGLLPLTKTDLEGGNARARRKRASAMTEWFYAGGGILLSGDAHQAFVAARKSLEDEDATEDRVSKAMTALRTELKIDVLARDADERDVPMAPSQARREW